MSAMIRRGFTQHGRNFGSRTFPFPHRSITHDSWLSFHSTVLEFAFPHGAVSAGQYGSCPNGNNLDKATLDRGICCRRSQLYHGRRIVQWGAVWIGIEPCREAKHSRLCHFTAPENSGIINHIELKVIQNQIEVWATDAGSTVLRKIATVTNANLSFTRGLIWLQDVHYNADKAECGPDVPFTKTTHVCLGQCGF